ncbi:MAG: type I-E CRISPR-associated protein Cse2/CasB [Desulfomonile tiedjei]|uniref:Type I-E CRISPR-associated protein Cse2/CasB n=1 Tax=Desulfomonile tiedjei TaxID=2358 RepID=A0A9D6V2I1_9BACT|nr:type I-E CRISPR-associated protein Cse2/CasB [Desulfomonile tiedjei]
MSHAAKFIRQLEGLKEGERSQLRRLAGKPLDEALQGFDLLTGLWWPLRRESQAAPRRETSWLLSKLYAAFPLPHVRPEDAGARPTLPRILGRCEPSNKYGRLRFRARFDTLLCTQISALEPHLHWALSTVADAVKRKRCAGLDWAQLLEDLSIWDRGAEHRRRMDVREEWACHYLKVTKKKGELTC